MSDRHGGVQSVIRCARMPFWWTPDRAGVLPDVTGQWLASYDPAARSGAGWSWTSDRAQAMRFGSAIEAHQCWTQVNPRRPVRPVVPPPYRRP